jgi:hypothetical protein
MTSTQSFVSGGVKFVDPVVGYVPINVASAVRGLNHHAFAEPPDTWDILMVTVRPLGM